MHALQVLVCTFYLFHVSSIQSKIRKVVNSILNKALSRALSLAMQAYMHYRLVNSAGLAQTWAHIQ